MSSILFPDILLIRPHISIADRVLVAGGPLSYTFYLFYPFLSLMGLEPTISSRAVRARRIPSLGGYSETRGGIVLLIGCFSGMVFGGIHCLGWNYLDEQASSWRITSLAILCAPVSILLSYGYGVSRSHCKYLPSMEGPFRTTIGICSAIYITARIGIIVLMLLSLRWLPAGVYQTVAWTKFIPHY
jgi:hypothetical protein